MAILKTGSNIGLKWKLKQNFSIQLAGDNITILFYALGFWVVSILWC